MSAAYPTAFTPEALSTRNRLSTTKHQSKEYKMLSWGQLSFTSPITSCPIHVLESVLFSSVVIIQRIRSSGMLCSSAPLLMAALDVQLKAPSLSRKILIAVSFHLSCFSIFLITAKKQFPSIFLFDRHAGLYGLVSLAEDPSLDASRLNSLASSTKMKLN